MQPAPLCGSLPPFPPPPHVQKKLVPLHSSVARRHASSAHYILAYGYPVNEAIEATSHFLQSDTRYAQGYSDVNFGRIRPGMDGRQVFEAVGVPYERHDNDTEWLYSLAQGTTNYYHERKVILAKDSKGIPRVKEVVYGFHAD